MVKASYPALEWAREVGEETDPMGWDVGYIRGFLNGDMADLVTWMYVDNVMRARLRGVSA